MNANNKEASTHGHIYNSKAYSIIISSSILCEYIQSHNLWGEGSQEICIRFALLVSALRVVLLIIALRRRREKIAGARGRVSVCAWSRPMRALSIQGIRCPNSDLLVAFSFLSIDPRRRHFLIIQFLPTSEGFSYSSYLTDDHLVSPT
jgi:hypothetical protein